MAIQMFGLKKWPIVPFDRQHDSLELAQFKARYAALAQKMPSDLITQIRWLHHIGRLTEGEMVVTTEGAHNRNLRIGLNEFGRMLLSAFRTEDGSWDVVKRCIHDIPPGLEFDEAKYAEFEASIFSAAGHNAQNNPPSDSEGRS